MTHISTLAATIFVKVRRSSAVLECVPGDLLGYLPDPADLEARED